MILQLMKNANFFERSFMNALDKLSIQIKKQHKKAIGNSVKFRTQYHRKGTAHALLQAKPDVIGSNITVVLNGDIPLISGKTISRIIQQC